MTFAETRIYYGQDLAFEPEEPVEYGEKVTTLVIQKGWISPNYMLGQHWSRTKPVKDRINAQVANHIMQLPPEDRQVAQLREPVPRMLRIRIVQSTGRWPDIDNLTGGLKYLLDALRKVKYRRKKIRDNVPPGAYATHTGNGLIWDDAPQYLRIGEIFVERTPKGTKDKVAGNYVVVDVFEFPTEEGSA